MTEFSKKDGPPLGVAHEMMANSIRGALESVTATGVSPASSSAVDSFETAVIKYGVGIDAALLIKELTQAGPEPLIAQLKSGDSETAFINLLLIEKLAEDGVVNKIYVEAAADSPFNPIAFTAIVALYDLDQKAAADKMAGLLARSDDQAHTLVATLEFVAECEPKFIRRLSPALNALVEAGDPILAPAAQKILTDLPESTEKKMASKLLDILGKIDSGEGFTAAEVKLLALARKKLAESKNSK